MLKAAIASFTVLVLLVSLCASLPWEDIDQFSYKLANSDVSVSKRAVVMPPCPVHPRPVPQALITARFLPELLRNATRRMAERYRAQMPATGMTAVSLGVVYDQSLVWEQGFGLINPSDPTSQVNADTIFRIGSITKLITNMMLFKLRDEGKLSLDDPISKYVPELTWQSPFKNNPGITWRTLAGQTSGLSGVTPCNFFTLLEPVLGDACDISNAEAWKRVTAQPPTVPMWQDPHYADSAYAIIGRALESVVGMSWEDYVVQHIFKPLGMDSTYVAFDGSMAKRVPPGQNFNTTFPDFVSHVDLRWARPTGNVYSTVRDLAKLASVFMVGDGESKNALGLFTSTIREMLTPSFVNDERSTGYGYPFEIQHTSTFGQNLPQYWIRAKGGSMPGYFTVLIMLPEIKTSLIIQATGVFPGNSDLLMNELLPAMEQTLWDLQPLPKNPGNLTAFEGNYSSSVYFGYIYAGVAIKANLVTNTLQLTLSLKGQVLAVLPAIWEEGNTFRVLGSPEQPCLFREAGFTNVLAQFNTESGWLGENPTEVVSLELPSDPFYGWVFTKL